MVGYSADDYLRFSADKETIYYSEPVYACEDAYVLPTNDNSEQWGVRSDGHWTYVNCLMYSFPPQGWKIHITSTIYDAQNVLYDVAEYLFVKSISKESLISTFDKLKSPTANPIPCIFAIALSNLVAISLHPRQ